MTYQNNMKSKLENGEVNLEKELQKLSKHWIGDIMCDQWIEQVEELFTNALNQQRESMIQKKKIMLHKTKEHATDVIPKPTVESWEESFDEKWIQKLPEGFKDKNYAMNPHSIYMNSTRINSSSPLKSNRLRRGVFVYI